MDINYLLFLQKIRTASEGIFDSFMLSVSDLGTSLLLFLVLGAIYWCVSKRAGQLMALNISLACTYNQALKRIFKIERPWIQDSRIEPVSGAIATAGGYSFPSGHTSRATAGWGALAYYLWGMGDKVLSCICWAIVILVAFSRNYLGVHTFKDIIVAFIAGIIVIAVIDFLLKWADKGKNRDIVVAVAFLLLCFIPMIRVGCLTNAGAGMGFVIGWIIERHFIDFDIKGSWQVKCIRFAIGGAGIAFICSALSSFLNQFTKYGSFFAMFVLGIFVMAIYPYCFSKKERFKTGIVSAVIIITAMTLISYGWYRYQAAIVTDEEDSIILEQSDANKNTDPVIIAHRGYSGYFPENTLTSFKAAIDIDVDYIELDVQLFTRSIEERPE